MDSENISKLKKAFVRGKIYVEKTRRDRFSPIPRPVGAPCPYDREFYSALECATTEPSDDNIDNVVIILSRAARDGHDVNDYFKAISSICISGKKP